MGFPSPAADYTDDRIDLNHLLVPHPSATFYMSVKTEAMAGDGILPGSLAIIDRSLTARNNDIVVAVVNGEIIMRRIETKPELCLSASNSKFKKITISEGSDFRVWGVVSVIISNPNQLSHVCLGGLQ